MLGKQGVKKFVTLLKSQAFWGLVTYPIVTTLVYLLSKAGSYFLGEHAQYVEIKNSLDFLIGYFEHHPTRILITSVFVGILFTTTLKSINQKRLINAFGASFFSPHNTDEQINKDWLFFSEKFDVLHSQHLDILGSTGQDTFAKKDSPLHKLVCEFKGSIRIVLLNPDSECITLRANSLKIQNPSDYRNEIIETINYLKDLSKSNSLLEVRLYKSCPSWKMLITDNLLWLQYYKDGNHVDETAVYLIHRNNSSYPSLYQPFYSEFNRIWKSADHCDFDKYTRKRR